ncbi:hypothetical protein LY76DRAFT_610590 [Colletotrichum caudatum]|nr:hypothetical protein LY76DRAFT_610590 [Colletotrichum caudatum]
MASDDCTLFRVSGAVTGDKGYVLTLYLLVKGQQCRDHALVDAKGRPLWLLEAIRHREAPDMEYPPVAHEEWHPAQSDWLTAKLRKTWPEPGRPAPHVTPAPMEPPSRPAAVSDDEMAYIRTSYPGTGSARMANSPTTTMSGLAPVFQSHLAKWLPENCDDGGYPLIIIHAWIDDDLEKHGEEGASHGRAGSSSSSSRPEAASGARPGDDAAGFRWEIKVMTAMVFGLRRRGADTQERTASYVRNVLDRLQSACDARARANDDDSDDDDATQAGGKSVI